MKISGLIVLATLLISIPAFSLETGDYALFVTIKIRPESVIEYKNLLRPYLKKVKEESGIWTYKMHQSSEDATTFEIYAHFASKEAHDTHLNQEHTKSYLAVAKPLFEDGYPVRRKFFEVRP